MVRRLENEKGVGMISLALTLPIVLIALFASMQFFLYFRAVSIVGRAAAEAAQALATSLPGHYSPTEIHSLAKIDNREEPSTTGGRRSAANIHRAFSISGQLYERADGKTPGAVKLPFLLSKSENGPNSRTRNPGVQYLPMVTAWTCLEPLNETSHTLEQCGSNLTEEHSAGSFLSYQLPTKMDFDGDGHEDLAFYYPNSKKRRLVDNTEFKRNPI